MSLGFARDSILDLASMAKEHEENESNGGGDFSSQSSLNDSGEKKNTYFAQQQQQQEQAPAQAASELGLVLGGPPSTGGRRLSASSVTSSAGQSSSSSIGNRSHNKNRQERGANKGGGAGAYSAFAYDYSAYAEYYEEADAWVDSSSSMKDSNVFCCLFAPWRSQSKDDDDDDDSDDDDSDRSCSSTVSGDEHEGAREDVSDANAAEVGPERSSSKLAEHDHDEGEDDDAPLYRGGLEANDSIALAKAKELGLPVANDGEAEAPSVASSAVSVLPVMPSHAEEKKGEEEDHGESVAVSTDAKVAAARTSTSTEEDDVTSHASGTSAASGDTNVYGEKLTDRDRQAVMARLRLSMGETTTAAATASTTAPPPEVSTNSGSGSKSGSASANAKSDTATKKKIKGILKNTSSTFERADSVTSSHKAKSKDQLAGDGSPDRRSLFPLYAPRKVYPDPSGSHPDGLLIPSSSKSITFSPMARVVSIPSRRDMGFVDKAGVWWQRSDYDDFKKVHTVVYC